MCIFVDFGTAFDLMSRKALSLVPKAYNVLELLVSTIIAMYQEDSGHSRDMESLRIVDFVVAFTTSVVIKVFSRHVSFIRHLDSQLSPKSMYICLRPLKLPDQYMCIPYNLAIAARVASLLTNLVNKTVANSLPTSLKLIFVGNFCHYRANLLP